MTPPPLRFAVQGSGRMAARMRALVGDAPFEEADAVYIATRNADHVERSIMALEAGKPVLCEKPFALDPIDAARVLAAASANRRLFMEAVATPFLPAVAAAIAAAQSGRLGRLRRLEASFGYPVDSAREPRLFACGVLADRAVYPMMLALIAFGPGKLTQAEVTRDDTGLDVAARLRLDHDDGRRSDLAVSFEARLGNSLRIEGDVGIVEIAPPLLSAQRLAFAPSRLSPSLRQHPLVRRLGDLGARIGGGWHPYGASPYAPEIAHFSALVRDGALESPVVSHQRMADAVRLIAEVRARCA